MKTILISGSNGNLGSFYAQKQLESTDNNLILLYHKRNDRIKPMQDKFPQRVRLIKADITDYNELLQKLDLPDMKIDALLHTASKRSSDFMILEKTNPKHWQDVISTNILGTYNILKIVLCKMKRQKNGRIVLLGSNVSRIGLPNGSAYAASKSAIANLSRTVALEEAENNILINTISPGPIQIDDSHFDEEYRKFRASYYKKMLMQIPLKRLATLEDLYNLIEFLLSDKNSYITGEEIFVTGGKL